MLREQAAASWTRKLQVISERTVSSGGGQIGIYLVNVEEGGAELAEAASLDSSLEGLTWSSSSE